MTYFTFQKSTVQPHADYKYVILLQQSNGILNDVSRRELEERVAWNEYLVWNPYISLILENTTSSCSTTSSGISAASSSARWLCTNHTKQIILHVSGFLYIQWQQITTKRDLANTGGGRGLSEGKIYYQLRKSAAPVEQLRLYKMLVHHRCFSAELLVDVIY